MLPCSEALLTRSLEVAMAEVGTLEQSNRNDGAVVKYLKPFGLPSGTQYCAAGQYYCFLVAANYSPEKVPIAKTALAQGVYNDAKRRGSKVHYQPQVHDLVVWRNGNSSKGHIERIYKVEDGGWVNTIAFNSSRKVNGRVQEGVFLKRRNLLHPMGRLIVKGLVGFEWKK